jgi:integrase
LVAWTNPKTGKVYEPDRLYPVTYWGFDTWFDRVKEVSEIEGLTIHDLRRTAGSRLLRDTGNMKLVQQKLGHKTFAQTAAAYAHLSDEEMLEDMLAAERRMAERRRAAEVPPKNPPKKFGDAA